MRLWKQAMCTAAAAVCLASAANGQVVISQVYGGGGNNGSFYRNDFIEIFNRGTAAVDLTGWSVQYTSATGTTWTNITPLTGVMLQPGQYYLIQEAAGAAGAALPTADATGTIAMSGTAGKVALCNSIVALTGACPTGGSIQDFVGFGTTANCFEGTGPTPAPSNANAVFRAGNGCLDGGQNATEFSAAAASPRNTGSPLNVCPLATPPTGSGASTPGSECPGFPVLITFTVTPGANPTSTGLGVTADLSLIGGSSSQQFFDNATNGDVTSGDGIFSFQATIGAMIAPGAKNIPATITDAQSRTGQASTTVTVNNCNPRATTGTGASPSGVCNGESSVLTVNVTPGIQPASTGITVRADLSAFFGATDQLFTDNGNNNFTYTLSVPNGTFPTNNLIVFTVADQQGRSTMGSITLTNANCVQSTTSVVISQVYGGGGNAGAPLQNDFIELYNRTNAAIDLTGWSVQYASAGTGSSGFSNKTDLTGSIPANGYYLIIESAGNSCGGLPCGDAITVTPGATGTLTMSASDGRVALVNDGVLLGASCTGPTVVDLVGYGSGASICFEGAGAAPGLSNTTADYRRDNGQFDSNNNVIDFFAASPLPHGSMAATGACCAADGGCSVATMAGCSSGYQGDGTSCSPNNCPQPTGACCATDGGCTTTTSVACSGTYQGNGSSCSPNPCAQPTGACCLNGGGCSSTTSANCQLANGNFQGAGTSCTPNPCPQANGACCCGSNCSVTTANGCLGPNRTFAGSGSSCTPFSNTAPCCRGDYNKTGAPATVQDIFDFLSGYFSNDACANTNDSVGPNNGVSVQDIFDFLAAYFGGGC